MNNICTNRCSLHLEKQRCPGHLRIPQTPAEARKRNLDAEKKSGSHYKFQCNHEERRRKTEAKRKRLIQKLKSEYRINVDGLSSQVLENILVQEEILEKQKRTRERDKIQRRFHFVSKLVQDEKYRCRDAKSLPPLRKKAHKIRRSDASEACPARTGESENSALSLNPEVEGSEESDNEIDVLAEDARTIVTEESESDSANKCDPKQSQEPLLPLELFASPKERPVLLSAGLKETHLRCNPECIVFENLERNKTYTRTYKISNVGLDDIHCRYAGIATENEATPAIKVEMTDSALLRPGLSFAGKVKIIASVDVTESKGFLIYETRRKKNPNEKACFEIPFRCLPVRSIVEVSPSVIRFPCVTWCTATGKQRLKLMRKTVRIKNLGGKACSCRIVNSEYSEAGSAASKTHVGEEGSVQLDLSSGSGNEEYLGESNCFPGECEEVPTIISELLDNVFKVFRFSRKYHIPLPAKSTTEVDLDFLPEYRGYHHQVAFIRFEGADNCTEKKLEMTGEIEKVPLRVEPPTVDLKICIINGGLYEGTFRVCNESKSPFPVRLKVPDSLKQHCLVFPRESIIQPRSHQTCSVRLFPRPSISNDALRYYKQETKVLEFPVFIQPLGKHSCKWDRIKLYVFAVLTSGDLELRPPEINFGPVTTLETVRTEITLTNHSMCPQEFGFLHLPKGVRIEPNFGFGTILPKETIKLGLLYSPILSCKNKLTEEGTFSFRVEVTTLAKLCGFPKPVEETLESESTKSVWGEEPFYSTEADETPREMLSLQESQASDGEEEEGPSSSDDEDELRVLQNNRERIREYMGRKTDSSPARASADNAGGGRGERGGEGEDSSAWSSPRDARWTITCKAFVIKPFCELSSTVIQLPATPLSSTSVTRFRIDTSPPEKCDCNYSGGGTGKKSDFFFEAFFEFHASSTLITIEPNTGHIIRGQSIPVAIIFRPEFSKSELIYQSRVLKAQFSFEQAKPKNDYASVKSKNKTKTTKQIREASRSQKVELERQDVNLTNLEITEHDLFAGEKALQRMIDPFHLEFKVVCIMKILPCQGVTERMEQHSLKLIAPVINPSFVYLGNCQEISFGKIAVGGSARKIIQIQNTSLNRISPRISALNPYGPFTCTTGSRMDRVDPEHIWRQPLTFSPSANKGKETEFFEVRCGATSMALAVNGEGIVPRYTLTPDFALCYIETSVDVVTEVELLLENSCEAELRFRFELDFIKERPNKMDESALFENVEKNIRETNGNLRSDVTFRKPERKGNRMTKDGSKRIVFINELTPEVASQLETEYTNIQNPGSELFTIVGLNKRNEVLLNPFGKCQLKVRFCPIKELISNKEGEGSPSAAAYAVRYKMMLFGTMLKNLTIIGTVRSEK